MFRFLVKLPNVLLISLTIIAGSITLALALARPNEVPIRRSLDFSARVFLLRTFAFPCTCSFSKLDPRIRLSNTTLSNVTLGQQSCRSNYGTGLTMTSCTNAWEKIPQDSETCTYGLRADIAAGAHLDVGLPVRYLSDDGLCAIDIYDKIILLHNCWQETQQETSRCLKLRRLCLMCVCGPDIREGPGRASASGAC